MEEAVTRDRNPEREWGASHWPDTPDPAPPGGRNDGCWPVLLAFGMFVVLCLVVVGCLAGIGV